MGEQAFENASKRLKAKKKHALLLTLHRMASERIFLLELKTKYAGIKRIDCINTYPLVNTSTSITFLL